MKEENKCQIEADKKYSNYLEAKSTTRIFIKNMATIEDLAEILRLVAERRQELEK